LEAVKEQVEFNTFADPRRGFIDPMYNELCMIIAEIYTLNPGTILKIGGTETEARIVQDVYGQLRNDHLRLVSENIKNQTARIYNKKSYLRTALYNVVFEIETHYTNLVAHDMRNG